MPKLKLVHLSPSFGNTRGGGFKKINFGPAQQFRLLKTSSFMGGKLSKNIILLFEKEGTSGAGDS